MRILVIGDNCIDVYLPPINKKYVGGCAVNVAIHLVNLGYEVSYMGVVGSDIDSEIIRSSLDKMGLDLTNLSTKPGIASNTETKIVNGEKTIVREELGAQLDFATRGIFNGDQIDFISGFDYVYYTGFSSWQYIKESEKTMIAETVIMNLKLLNKSGSKVIFDYGENKLAGLLKRSSGLVDYAFFSLSDLGIEEVKRFAEKIIETGCSIVGITLGAKGAVIANNNETLYFPAPDIEVVDTLGAGDAFIGTFIANYLKGGSLKISGEKAMDAAGMTCLHVGGCMFS